VAVLVVLASALVLTGCPNPADSGGGDITYEAVQEGGVSSKTTSTGIELTFSAALNGLTAGEINVNNYGGEVIKGVLTGEGVVWHSR
jgi:predicted small secreted protein